MYPNHNTDPNLNSDRKSNPFPNPNLNPKTHRPNLIHNSKSYPQPKVI